MSKGLCCMFTESGVWGIFNQRSSLILALLQKNHVKSRNLHKAMFQRANKMKAGNWCWLPLDCWDYQLLLKTLLKASWKHNEMSAKCANASINHNTAKLKSFDISKYIIIKFNSPWSLGFPSVPPWACSPGVRTSCWPGPAPCGGCGTWHNIG